MNRLMLLRTEPGNAPARRVPQNPERSSGFCTSVSPTSISVLFDLFEKYQLPFYNLANIWCANSPRIYGVEGHIRTEPNLDITEENSAIEAIISEGSINSGQERNSSMAGTSKHGHDNYDEDDNKRMSC
ncbi:hypothetical protein ACQ4LE_009157 [Meloidogyne hapla]